MKLVLNSMTLGTIAMTGGELADKQPEGMKELMMQLGSDSLKIGEALGHPIVPIFGLTSAEIEGSNNMLMKLVDKVNHDIGPGRGANTTLQDHMKGPLSEIDLINGSRLRKAADTEFRPLRTRPSSRSRVGSTPAN